MSATATVPIAPPDPREHLGLVYREARRVAAYRRALGFRDPDVDTYEHFVGDGYLGLVSACERFDASRGLKLSTIATPRIRGAITDGIRSQYKTRRKSHVEFLSIDNAPELRLIDVAPLAVDAQEIESVREAVRVIVDAPEVLTRQQRMVVVRRYWHEERLHEIARRLRLTESRVSQILSDAHEALFGALLPVILGAPAGLLRTIQAKREPKANRMPRRFKQKRCAFCGKGFTATGPRSLYCSAPCRKHEGA